MLTKGKILKLQVRARRRHNLTKEEFYDLTPGEYTLYEKDLEDEMKGWDMRVARILAMLANIHKDAKSTKQYTEDDFMPKTAEDMRRSVATGIRALAKQFNFKRVE